jgi:WD40 repeat protein
LSDLSLLYFDFQTRTIRLHSVIRSYLGTRLSDDPSVLHKKLVTAWGDLRHLPDEYAWKWLGYHLIAAKQAHQFSLLLLDFDWLQAKLQATDTAALIADYDLLPDDEELSWIRGALHLSAHILDESGAPPSNQEPSNSNPLPDNKTQLAGQLLGRLLSFSRPGIQSLLLHAAKWQGAPWLSPLTSSLTAPGGPLICTLRGHTDEVTAIALTRNGQKIVTGSSDTSLKVWRLGDSRELLTLSGHVRQVTSVVVTPDGRRAVSGSLSSRESNRELSAPEQTLVVWDLETGAQLRTLRGHTDDVTTIALTPDGDLLVTGSADTTIKVWDLNAGKELLTLRGHTRQVTGLAITSDGRRAVSGSMDRSIKVWDLKTGALLRTLSASKVREKGLWLHLLTVEPGLDVTPNSNVGAVGLTPDGQRVVSSAPDRTMKIWDLEKDTAPDTLRGHKDHIAALAVLPDGNRVISASLDRTLKVWDLEKRKCTHTFAGHTARVRSVAVTPDGARAVSGSKDKTLKVWRLEQNGRLSTKGHKRHISALAVTPNGESVVSASFDRSIRVWNAKTGDLIKVLLGHKKGVTGLAITPDGKRLVSTSHDCTLKVWDLQSGGELLTSVAHNSPVLTVVINLNRSEAISISEDGSLFYWDLDNWKVVRRVMDDRTKSDHAIAILDLGNVTTVVKVNRKTGTVDGIDEKDKIKPAVLATIVSNTRRITKIAITPDEHQAMAGSLDGTVRVWDWSNGTLLRTLKGHLGPVTDLAMTPDGRRIVSTSKDCTLKIWELHNGKRIATFSGDSELRSCAITPDADTIIAGEESGRVHFLRLEGV